MLNGELFESSRELNGEFYRARELNGEFYRTRELNGESHRAREGSLARKGERWRGWGREGKEYFFLSPCVKLYKI